MNTSKKKPSRRIVLRRYLAAVLKSGCEGVAKARLRERWSAEYVEGDTAREHVDGYLTFDDAIGALIREMAQSCESVDAVLDFVAALFSDLTKRTADVSLSRAVWIAARSKKRRCRGIAVEFPPEMRFTGCGRACLHTPVAKKGGAA